ncbi:hypothetical protein BB560_006202 [Smittium megazygosporum]|uniref:Uncharacterized protein n=1 Tax=Smittium megazygosporum TaxID=133381 RepID=A0A2T9YDN1_9FUNG|nr:hypothetical protein BB560_006202 [Smittium megazygosporum]
MSTTSPGAAKPDGFAIGSISKRDRSDPIDQSVKKSFFNREIIEKIGVVGDPIPDFSDGMDKDLLE